MSSRRWVSSALHAAFVMRRGLTMGVRAVIENEAGEVALVRHTYVAGWHFPGGGVDPGETAAQAVAREVREEAAIRLIGEPELVGVYLNRRLRARPRAAVSLPRMGGGARIPPEWRDRGTALLRAARTAI
jgi:8-oxo-dGTP pyrophosphatase MutT (NUDIX family)